MKIITHSGKEFDSVDAYQQHTVERIKEKCPDAIVRNHRDTVGYLVWVKPEEQAEQ
jgi:hypothetical protein